MRLNPEHPPLVKDIAGIPLLFLGISDRAFTQTPWTTDVNGQWNFGRTVIFHSDANPDRVTQLARLPVLLTFFLVGCFFIWRWTRKRAGDQAALVATTLFAFSPTVLAHARLVTTDVAAAVGVLVATYYFIRFLKSPNRGTFILSALTFGIALLCKFNTVLLIPYFLLGALLYGLPRQRAIRSVGLTALISITACIGVVWPVYIVQTWHYPADRQIADTQKIMSYHSGTLKPVTLWMVTKPPLRPLSSWMMGLTMAIQRSSGGNIVYWFGTVLKSAGPGYFPIVSILKEPLAWWLLVVVAIATTKLKISNFKFSIDEWMWLLWLGIYWAVSMHSTLNIGIRHMLPVYPFTIMLVAGALSRITDRRVIAVSALLVGWYIFESISVFPYYLTYFNQLAGGPSGGYRYVVDSNLDWGQDLKRLGQWVEDKKIPRLTLDYFGWADPSYYLGERYIWSNSKVFTDARDFLARNQSNGWLAVSATFLQNNPDAYGWLTHYQPTVIIGHSIFVYHITK